MSFYGYWKPYVPVARRRAKAATFAARLAKKEKRALAPVLIEGRGIANSYWGQAWCENLECYSDFENRLPRGRTYVRNGSVIDLQIYNGVIKALVSGSDVYTVAIKIKTLTPAVWKQIKRDCSQSIASLIDLLQGRFDRGIMERLSQRDGGLFPRPKEIDMNCTCPDWAGMCKHVAAVLYGVGARLDAAPEMLFTLRNVDHLELVGQAVAPESLERALTGGQEAAIAESDLGAMFGIDIDIAKPARKGRRSGGDKTAPPPDTPAPHAKTASKPRKVAPAPPRKPKVKPKLKQIRVPVGAAAPAATISHRAATRGGRPRTAK
jgi:uncharacterized Zn finger protein